MMEREPRKETVPQGTLLYLGHPGSEDTISGYGVTMIDGRRDQLVGLLMVDRPEPVSPDWLGRIGDTFGGYQLLAMTESGDRGILCQMTVEPDSLSHLRQLPGEHSDAIESGFRLLLDYPPQPRLSLRWDDDSKSWVSRLAVETELPAGLYDVFASTGYGCVAFETGTGVIHACHASDRDIEGFAGQPVCSTWQLIQMPTAPLIRLELTILDDPSCPFRFESFLNVADPDQLRILARLASQEDLHLAFYGDDLAHHSSLSIPHTNQQWQQVDEMAELAIEQWLALSAKLRDFDLARASYMAFHF